ncbi:hypothetical protein [Paenibacillus lupini]|uniref:hypothetical protein n=1 Tax=Paenibacillus lupini TaxID=1450204 RepID=UPI00141FAC31|nr:hypothetical protein [Paenibacillus lupini]NIK26903.1 hypothetical protein [Paenibacillus lupini]
MAKHFLILLISVFLLQSCSSSAENLELDQSVNEAISNYIVDQYKDVYSNSDKAFEVHKVYGSTETGNEITVYIYSLYGGFNKNSRNSVNGHSLPAVVKLKEVKGVYTITSYKEPKDGDEFNESTKLMFPKKYHTQIWDDVKNAANLQDDLQEKANQWQKS